MRRILLIYHGWGIGGGLIAMIGLIHQLKRQYDVHVLCIYNSNAVDYIKNEGISVEVLNSFFYRRLYSLYIKTEASYFSVPGFCKRTYALLMYYLNKYIVAPSVLKNKLGNFDILYLNSLFITDWAMAAQKRNKKVVLHVREPLANDSFKYGKNVILRNIKKYVDCVIAISKDNASRLSGIKNVRIVYDPVVDVNRGDLDIAVESDLKYFVYVGGEQRIKGFEQLALSLDYLNKNVRIFFIGQLKKKKSVGDYIRFFQSSYYRKLSFLRQKILSSEKIINVGHTNNVFSYYKKAIAVISPFSKPHASLPILEAFSIGKPVIASDIEGTDELVSIDTGFLFHNGNFKELAEVVNYFAKMDNRQLMDYSTASYLHYKHIYTLSESVPAIINEL